MLKTTSAKIEAIEIPAQILKKLALKDGEIITARVEKGKIFILEDKNKTAKIMKYAGIWKDEDVDSIFGGIRREWHKWKKNLHA